MAPRPGPFGTGPLTKLDERVLAAITGRSRTVLAVTAMVNAHERRHCMPVTSENDVRLVLRGFEHLGKAKGRGGWWRAL